MNSNEWLQEKEPILVSVISYTSFQSFNWVSFIFQLLFSLYNSLLQIQQLSSAMLLNCQLILSFWNMLELYFWFDLHKIQGIFRIPESFKASKNDGSVFHPSTPLEPWYYHSFLRFHMGNMGIIYKGCSSTDSSYELRRVPSKLKWWNPHTQHALKCINY